MFIQSIMLPARERGLATCPQASWQMWSDTIRENLGLDRDEMIMAGISLDYAGVPEAQQAQEAGAFDRLDVMLKSDDIREGLNAFLEKRRPQWAGR